MHNKNAFTLIELSIVLVIIGLIVGGILVGRDLISAAAVRAQISQIEKYQQAINTFRGKYGYLPGDIPDPYASKFGFTARGNASGQGDGNGLIDGVQGTGVNCATFLYPCQGGGETAIFWVDLSTARLIDKNFTLASPSVAAYASGTNIDSYLPSAVIGRGNYLYVWDGSDINANWGPASGSGINYISISAVTGLGTPSLGFMASSQGLTVREAFMIDSKVDDGFPQTGRAKTVAILGNTGAKWATGDTGLGEGNPDTRATAGSSLTCYDNGNSAGATQTYSVQQNNGTGVNCSLTFRLQ